MNLALLAYAEGVGKLGAREFFVTTHTRISTVSAVLLDYYLDILSIKFILKLHLDVPIRIY